MRICDDLRQAVLQAAIQGKLTKQLPEDGNAASLLKKAPRLADTEGNLFDIPSSWIWARLGDIGSFTRGSGIKRSEITLEGYPCIRYGELYTTYHNVVNEVRSKTSVSVFKKSKKIKHGDIVMALTGENNFDIALASAYIGDDIVAIGGDMTAFTHKINPLYLVIAINSPYGIKCKSRLATGNIIVHISNDKLASIPVPLPPLAEQQRIVSKVEELMARIDDLEKTEIELVSLKAAFPSDMKAALLQAAMQGKLTEQLPEDGDAADLLKQIAKEKNLLIKEGKIKKEKPLPEISLDEVLFDIPDNWKWCRFGSIVNYHMGKTPPRNEIEYWNNEFPWVSIADMIENGYVSSTKEKVSNSTIGTIFKKVTKAGTMLMSFKLTVGRVSILNINAVHNEAIISIYPYVNPNEFTRDYLFKILPFVTQWGDSKKAIKGKTLNGTSISNLLIPLPPLAEQKRIVEKLDKLLPLCDGLIEE